MNNVLKGWIYFSDGSVLGLYRRTVSLQLLENIVGGEIAILNDIDDCEKCIVICNDYMFRSLKPNFQYPQFYGTVIHLEKKSVFTQCNCNK